MGFCIGCGEYDEMEGCCCGQLAMARQRRQQEWREKEERKYRYNETRREQEYWIDVSQRKTNCRAEGCQEPIVKGCLRIRYRTPMNEYATGSYERFHYYHLACWHRCGLKPTRSFKRYGGFRSLTYEAQKEVMTSSSASEKTLWGGEPSAAQKRAMKKAKAKEAPAKAKKTAAKKAKRDTTARPTV